MKQLNRKEEIALLVFVVLLAAIIIQLIWRPVRLEPFSAGRIIIAEDSTGFSRDLLEEKGIEITASSHNENDQTVNSLFDSQLESYWHVALDRRGEPAWVTIDFGVGNEKMVHSLAAFPRLDIPRQFFHRAELRGSDDGEDWETISEVIQEKRPTIAEWRKWTFDNDRKYRYYQFHIFSGYEGGKFLSLAELALFE